MKVRKYIDKETLDIVNKIGLGNHHNLVQYYGGEGNNVNNLCCNHVAQKINEF
jgi:hypothetical protein